LIFDLLENDRHRTSKNALPVTVTTGV